MKSVEQIAEEVTTAYERECGPSEPLSIVGRNAIVSITRMAARAAYAEAVSNVAASTASPTDEDRNSALVDVLPGYESLWRELRSALDQAQKGKGKERHNQGGTLPFDEQRMQQISRLIDSPDGMVYQACKKVVEGVKLPTIERQAAELHGAINYIAGIIIFLRMRDAKRFAPGRPASNPIPQPLPVPGK